MRWFLWYIFFFLPIINAFSQTGKFLLIGGGEAIDLDNSWNSKAYAWAIEQSENKRIAIVSTSAGDSWLSTYFMTHCEAQVASNFTVISNNAANSQSLYDTLITYDALFLKGSDQSTLYNYLKGTKVQEAIAYISQKGGVICGTAAGLSILSGVVYTAENGSAYSEETLYNPFNDFVTLSDGLFDFFPGYLFDSYFTLRARFGRLLGFMAHWQLKKGQQITGIGIDENTAFAIDSSGVGRVYGVGTVNIYKTGSNVSFTISDDHLFVDSVSVTQLLQGCTYNFKNNDITGFSAYSIPTIAEENRNMVLFASGGDAPEDNLELIRDFVNEPGFGSESIVIVTGANPFYAINFQTQLLNAGANTVHIVSAVVADNDNANAALLVQNAGKLLFVANDASDLFPFLQWDGVLSKQLKARLNEAGMVYAFIGDNSRFAGASVVTNLQITGAAFNGQLVIERGLGLMQTTVIIPNTFGDIKYLENMAAAVPYAMVNNKLAFGIWLNYNNYIKYKPELEKAVLHAGGDLPVLILKSEGTSTGNSTQTAYGDGYDDYPNLSGFKQMTLSFVNAHSPRVLGAHVGAVGTQEWAATNPFSIRQYGQTVWMHGRLGSLNYSVFNSQGQLVEKGSFYESKALSISDYNPGIYFLVVSDACNGDKQTNYIYR